MQLRYTKPLLAICTAFVLILGITTGYFIISDVLNKKEIIPIKPLSRVELIQDGGKIQVEEGTNLSNVDWPEFFNVSKNEFLGISFDEVNPNKTGIYIIKAEAFDKESGESTKGTNYFQIEVVSKKAEEGDKTSADSKEEKSITPAKTASSYPADNTIQSNTKTEKKPIIKVSEQDNKGVWKNYIGPNVKKLDKGIFGKYGDQAAECYKNALAGSVGQIEFENEEDCESLKNIMPTSYGLAIKSITIMSQGKVIVEYHNRAGNDIYIQEQAAQIAQQIAPSGGYEKDLINKVCQWVGRNLKYTENQNKVDIAYQRKNGNCEAISRLTKSVLECFGIDSSICAGTGDNIPHAWLNITLSNGDVWSDPTFYLTSGQTQYICTGNLWSSHTFQGIIR